MFTMRHQKGTKKAPRRHKEGLKKQLRGYQKGTKKAPNKHQTQISS